MQTEEKFNDRLIRLPELEQIFGVCKRTVRRKAPCGTAIVSPIRTVWLAFLTATVLTATALAAQKRAPRERLFTRRANQSHWSSRRRFAET